MNPIIEEILQLLPEDLREEFEERAAIIQYNSGVPRPEAEALAMVCVLRRHPDALKPRKEEDLI